MTLRSAGLFLESIAFTIVVPGSVTVLIPFLILRSTGQGWPQFWTWLQFAAVVPLTLGAAIYFRCLWDFAAKGRGIPSPIDHPRHLVVSGLYCYVRNPMYLGALTVLLGEATFFESFDVLIYALCWFLLVNMVVVFYEERTLRRRFGDSYLRYRAAVRRWIPGRKYAN
jgi:protein-S-isoprenylcysteine O-methyltransferase Ste14